jgi:two-component system phosphate regulon sensor histidine kinase PhoR
MADAITRDAASSPPRGAAQPSERDSREIAVRRVVWVLDDVQLDAERARRALVADYQVEVFNDATPALERLDGGSAPDVLVLDWVLPGVSGVDVCRFVRSLPGPLRNLPILFLTVRSQPEQVAEGLQAGANDYVVKPFAEPELRARVAALLRDKELLDRAENAERRLRDLLASSPDALLGMDAQGRIVFSNPEASRVLRQPAERLIGVSMSEVLPELEPVAMHRDGGPARLKDVRIGEEVFEPTVRRADGGAATIALRNVTEQRRNNERRLDLYSIVAHDLRSPLSAMLLRSELMVRGKHGLLSAPMVDELRALQRNISALVALVNDFLDLARLEGTGFDLDRRDFDLAAMVSSLCEELRPLATASKLGFQVTTPATDALVRGDRARLMQVVTNLLSNAIKFTPEGGRVSVAVQVNDDVVETTVEDTGVGISPDMLPSVFRRYVRGGGAQRKTPSTGLGLLIVREIVEAHEGHVGVDSQLGTGSKFWFRLPLAKPDPAP